MAYRLTPADDGRQTRVALTVEYSLQGMLAQFSRTNLVQDLGGRLVAEFAENLDRRFGQGAGTAPATKSEPPNLLRLIWESLRARLSSLLQRSRGR